MKLICICNIISFWFLPVVWAKTCSGVALVTNYRQIYAETALIQFDETGFKLEILDPLAQSILTFDSDVRGKRLFKKVFKVPADVFIKGLDHALLPGIQYKKSYKDQVFDFTISQKKLKLEWLWKYLKCQN